MGILNDAIDKNGIVTVDEFLTSLINNLRENGIIGVAIFLVSELSRGKERF